jgi:signal transduction histidine kinase
MKTAMTEPGEINRFEDLGRASMQIVHDLKNQLNGLKLYATFLRRRIEKGERPGDEQETIAKLIGGLDRAADDLSTIVRYGQPVELKKQAGIEINRMLREVCAGFDAAAIQWDQGPVDVRGEFDHFKLNDALNWLCSGALKLRENKDGDVQTISVATRMDQRDPKTTVIEWSGLRQLDHDPFRSFAGSDEIKLALAAKIIEAHGGSAKFMDKKFVVTLPVGQ